MHVSIFSSSLELCQLQAACNLLIKLLKMLHLSDNCNSNDLVSYTDQSIFQRPFFNETKEDESPLSYYHFPSSFIHYHELELDDQNFFLKQIYYDGLLLQHHHEQVTLDDIVVPEMVDSSNKSNTESNNGLAPEECNIKSVICDDKQIMPSSTKRSCSKKDRHSKINTAKGPRDRRMRLSLDVARKFFDLQDMLGYDKASKTVEWLLIQAKHEIKKLERCLPEVNCCGGFGGAKSTNEGEVEAVVMDKAAAIRGRVSVKDKKTKHSRKTIRPLAKDLREKARARARERTSYKKMWSRKFVQNKNHSSSELLADQVDQELISSNEQQPVNLGNQVAEQIVDDAVMIMEKWSPSSVSNYLQNIGIPQEHQFAGFQYFDKP